MYCKHCGREVADDSVFCQYCGGNLQGEKKPKNSLLKRFQSLNRGWQIIIMSYVIWLLIWMPVLIIVDKNDFDDALILAFVFVVVLPVVTLFVWYYKTHLKKAKTKTTLTERCTLVNFARKYGKMQVKTMANPATNEVRSYCAFINDQGVETKVEFGKSLGVLRPQEISERKDRLIIVQQSDGSFQLEML